VILPTVTRAHSVARCAPPRLRRLGSPPGATPTLAKQRATPMPTATAVPSPTTTRLRHRRQRQVLQRSHYGRHRTTMSSRKFVVLHRLFVLFCDRNSARDQSLDIRSVARGRGEICCVVTIFQVGVQLQEVPRRTSNSGSANQRFESSLPSQALPSGCDVLVRLTLDERLLAGATSASQLHCGAMHNGRRHDQTSEALATHDQARPMRRRGQAHAVAKGSHG